MNQIFISPSALLLLLCIIIAQRQHECHAVVRRLSLLGHHHHRIHLGDKKNTPPHSGNESSSSNDDGIVSSSLHGFPSFINENSKLVQHDTNNNIPQQQQELLESTIFLYRGGSSSGNSDNEDEIEIETINTLNKDTDHKVHTEDEIHVTSTTLTDNSSSQSETTPEVTVHKEVSKSSQTKKKSNAVGDPDGNSSDDESSSDEELDIMEELDEFEKELLFNELTKQSIQLNEKEQKGDFDTLIELAERREDMKRKISEMENELINRRKNNGSGSGSLEEEDDIVDKGKEEEQQKIDLDVELIVEEELEEGGEEEDEENEQENENENASSSSSTSTTSYHLSGTDVAKEDDVLKRERKYKRGSIFKGGTSSSHNKRRKTSSSNSGGKTKSIPQQTTASSPPVSVVSIPTTISKSTFDAILIKAFQSMIYLPPKQPRLPSPTGSVSLRNVDVSSRRRLDRRTLYHGLLAELGGSHNHNHHLVNDKGDDNDKENGSTTKKNVETNNKKDNSIDSMIRRRYLDVETSRSLKGALSLACQPKWRERLIVKNHEYDGGGGGGMVTTKATTKKDNEEDEDLIPTSWHRGGVCLFPTSDDDIVGLFDDASSSFSSNRRGSSHRHQQSQSFMGPQQGMGGMDGGPPPPQGFFGPMQQQEDEDGSLGVGPSSSTTPKPWRCTMGMQETVAMALAHSLSCGMAIIDDEALDDVRESVEYSLNELATKMKKKSDEEEEGDEKGDAAPPTINPEELRNSALLEHLVRLANDGKLGCGEQGTFGNAEAETGNVDKKVKATGFGKISRRMARDMELGLDDPNDDLAVESLRLMKEDEKQWFETIDEKQEEESESTKTPQPLVLFLRTDTSSSILKSKTAVETLAQECVKKDGIHLLMLGGKGIDASTTSFPVQEGAGQGVAGGLTNGRFNRQPSMHNQPQGGSPFSFMSNFPPGSPEFNAQMQQQHQQFHGQPQGGGPFSANNANASGQNDPEGSRRFNIFLARTVDPAGKPQIMGTIAPPQAGNLFPTILANMAKENIRKLQEQGIDEENEHQAMFIKQMEDLASNAERFNAQQQDNNDSSGTAANTPNAAFFNATITSPFGSEIFNRMSQQDGGEDGSSGEQHQFQPPEAVQRAIQDAMSGVIERLAQMSASATSDTDGKPQPGAMSAGIPLNIARAFSQVLSNENLRRGIAENLSRAAPALIDPRCQGVMLSVYVPPGPDHPNKGMMPGDQFKQGNNQMRQQTAVQPQQQQQPATEKSDLPHGLNGWLNKILSSSDSKGKDVTEKEESAVSAGESDDDNVTDTTTDVSVPKTNAQAEAKPSDKDTSIEKQQQDHSSAKPTKHSSSTKGKKSKRERNLDRARTLAVAAAAMAGAKKNRKENIKLTPEQKAERNLVRLQALCRHIPLPAPIDPVRLRSWEAWNDREEGSVFFRANKRALTAHLQSRNLSIDAKSGTKGAGIVLRQMMSVRDIANEEMEEVIKCAVEIEAGKSQRHHVSYFSFHAYRNFYHLCLILHSASHPFPPRSRHGE